MEQSARMSEAGGLLAKIEARLDTISDPCSVAMSDPMGLVEMGLVEHIVVADDGAVTVTLCLTDTSCVHFNGIVAYIRDALMPLDGVSSVSIAHTLETIWTDDRIRRRA
jgi:metal-sulfur cluster biosynthetic enzyme